ncbi:uncharacterized protein BX663DRAFT_493093 [Cokeromyces recurvatus]|uniref:uncharacterized protein n=1 Tax=Cokeromyces recurvatus TaxID=90255 RepID=UPI0022210D39|nr:uncharacterized protein BX663DRAFT_493093 [Cokeromyces recurvatus]KAI7908135.1 hypothetical protein BX663DRAFT_493093 [Cokeromyces recurvatus]
MYCVKEALVILIQHGLVYFTEHNNDMKLDATYYEINMKQILMRLRMGRIMRVTEEYHGKAGSTICQLLFLNGRLKLSQVQAWARMNQRDEATYVKVFTKMAVDQFIIPSLPQHSRSIKDQYLEAEKEELSKLKFTFKSPKKIMLIKDIAKANMDALFQHEREQIEQIGMKRTAKYPLEPETRKRFEQEQGTFHSGQENIPKEELLYDVEPHVFFVLNYNKYNVIFRNYLVSKFAIKRINRTAGMILKAFFRYCEDKSYQVGEDFSSAATPSYIANMLEPELFKKGDIILDPKSIRLQQHTKTDNNQKKTPVVSEVVEGYFKLLQTDQAGFLKYRDDLGGNHYSVNFKKLRYVMKRTIFENFLNDQFGIVCCRIVRILLDKGKLEETQIQKLAMLPLKDVRCKLNILMKHSIVEIQEVPRSSDHSTGRSFHLWFVSLDKCFEELLLNIYQTIVNLQQRKEEELLRRKRLINKLNRIDVIENRDLLNKIDQAEVAKMENVVEKIEVAKERLDELVMILQDI